MVEDVAHIKFCDDRLLITSFVGDLLTEQMLYADYNLIDWVQERLTQLWNLHDRPYSRCY